MSDEELKKRLDRIRGHLIFMTYLLTLIAVTVLLQTCK